MHSSGSFARTRRGLILIVGGLTISCREGAKSDGRDSNTATRVDSGVVPASSGPSGVRVPNRLVKGCLVYGDTVTLKGRVTERTVYGPPGFGEDTTVDARGIPTELELESPICAQPESQDDTLDPSTEPRADVGVIQLVLSDSTVSVGGSVGRTVTLRGVLFSSHTGYHHQPLLMDVVK